MYLGIILFPLISSIFLGLFGFTLGKRGSIFFSLACLFTASLLSIVSFFDVGCGGGKVSIKLFSWFQVGSLFCDWGFLFDSVTVVMLFVVVCISFLVHLYSISYMESDPHLTRFLCYLSLFTFFMLSLVTADNLFQLFLGWEGVGISSYLLINFWFTRVQANKAALKAIILNRFGDFCLLIGILGAYFVFRSINFCVIFSLVDSFKEHYFVFFGWKLHSYSFIVFFLFLGAVGKSAQLGLHTWLPDAMEGPTPVSALIHAATMVTAGVFVLVRMSPVLEYAPYILSLISFFGAMTAFFAATVGIFQNDLKRVIAYSTCSQLGYMVFACGLSQYSVALFHLMNHAFFKALLFLSAGAVIHALVDEQDMRRMGGLLHVLPYCFVSFLVGSMALMGFPYTTGFYSKDVILELSFASYHFEGVFCFWMGTLGACCTAFYSFRLIYLTFISETNFYRAKFSRVHDTPFILGLPLFILGFGSIFIGYFFRDCFIGLGSVFFGNSIGVTSFVYDLFLLEGEFLHIFYRTIPVLCSIIFGFFGFVVYHYFSDFLYFYKDNSYSNYMTSIYTFFNKKWFFDVVYNYYLVYPFLHFCKEGSYQLLDRGVLEVVGPTGLVRNFSYAAASSRKLQTGFIFHYIFIIFIGIFTYILADAVFVFFNICVSIYFLIIYWICFLMLFERKY